MKINKFSFILLAASFLLSCNNQSKQQNTTSSIILPSNQEDLRIIKGDFDIPEVKVIPSPENSSQIEFSSNEKVVDYDASPVGKTIAVITEKSTNNEILFWELGKNKISDKYSLPNGFISKSIAWHPLANSLFIMGLNNSEYQILRIEKKEDIWTNKCIFATNKQLRRLVLCPRPFITGYDIKTRNSYYEYRLFFGMDNGNKTYRIVSITEKGNKFYQVVGPKKTISSAEELNADIPPSTIESSWALPIAFHPAGHELIWEDKNNNFLVATYDSRAWGESKPINTGTKKGGSITPTPNGLGLINWQKEKSGIGIYLIPSKTNERQLTEYNFISTPSSVPDGKGIVGLLKSNNIYSLKYLPIDVPLADVLNAWMFIGTGNELDLFQKNFGLFRPNHSDQLYTLYETENYYCNDYDRSSPTRPYLVTTDIFWELFGAAYQGLFIVKERDEAIPNFWNLINEANSHYKNKNSQWSKVFSVLEDLNSNDSPDNPETLNIIKATNAVSKITGEEYAFSDLKPRGHYTSSAEMEKYFKAFRYFTTILANDEKAIEELEELPSSINEYAKNWINCYTGFIAPSRSPLVWENSQKDLPSYCKYPKEDKALFPLSWGFDNEVLFSTVYHRTFPEELQVKGPGGFRLLPSGLDLAATVGNQFAENLLESDYQKYPPLQKVIKNLKTNYKKNYTKPDFKENIYNSWFNAMAIQWADTCSSTNGVKDNNLWQTKRLQTGLATWATLRHATILVNERGVAECGEGGFEEILMRAPRGYVEPDPKTFGAIADLFEIAIKYVPKSISSNQDISESYNSENRSLYDGIISRLKDAAEEARVFQSMAEKEKKGIELTNEENEKIMYVARVAEHLFLVFNSLANKEYALSNPDPMPKIADVFGDGQISPFLLAAVGKSTEWNYIVPFYGRHQIVKGAVYSYYEFESDKLLNDEEWRQRTDKQDPLFWIKPYITDRTLYNMANTGY